MSRLRGGKRRRQRVRIGAPEGSLTAVSGMAAVTELVDELGVIALLDAAIGPIKQLARGHSGGELLGGWLRRSCPDRTTWWDWTGTAPTPQVTQ